jgi:hypothetical protein
MASGPPSNNFLYKCHGLLVLIGTSGREMFPDVMLTKYWSIENRYLVSESTNVDMFIAHFVGLLGFYVILRDSAFKCHHRFIKNNCLIWYERLSKFRIYVFHITATLLNTSSNRVIASRRFLQTKHPKNLQKSVPTEFFGKERNFTIGYSRLRRNCH